MRFFTQVFLLIVLLISTVASKENKKCCTTCEVKGEIKYYSIDKIFNRCGECCLKPSLFWLYKIFEKGLTEADSETPCEDLGYGNYETTETHGALFIKATLDKYSQ